MSAPPAQQQPLQQGRALAAGATPLQAATIANLAGGIVVMKLGTATVSRDELHRAIDLAPFTDDRP